MRFTLPDRVAQLALENQRLIYNLLFRAVSQCLLTVAADPKHLGARIGFFALLHTWGEKLQHHPHVHCVVAGGGLSGDGKGWIASRRGFFLPERVLSRLFRRLFLEGLAKAFGRGQIEFHGKLKELGEREKFTAFLEKVKASDWVVHTKSHSCQPERALEYLAHYTHRWRRMRFAQRDSDLKP